MEYLDLVFKAFSRRFQGFCFPVSCLPPRGTVVHGGKKEDGSLTLVGINKNATRGVTRLKALASILAMGLVFTFAYFSTISTSSNLLITLSSVNDRAEIPYPAKTCAVLYLEERNSES